MNKSLLFILRGVTALPVLADSGNSGIGDKKVDCPQSSNCQQKKNPGKRMIKMLSLRDDQVEEVMKVLKASHEKRQSLRTEGREQHKALHEQTLQQLEPLLDEEQMTRFVSFSERMKKRHQQRKEREEVLKEAKRGVGTKQHNDYL